MIQYLKDWYNANMGKVRTFDGGVELGGIMTNPFFQDLMVLNFFGNGKSYPLLHVQYVRTTSGNGMWVIQYLFFLRWASVKVEK